MQTGLYWSRDEPAGHFGASFVGDSYGPERLPRAKDPRENWEGRASRLEAEAGSNG